MTLADSRPATFTSTVAAEWIKLRSLRSTWWLLGGAAVLMLLLAALEPDDGDPTTVQATGVALTTVAYFVQYVLAAFATLAVTAEFATRSIVVTLACTPDRTRLMLAKAVVVSVVVFLTAVLITAMAVVVAGARFGELTSMGGTQIAGVVAISAYLALLAVIALGIGALVRRTAGSLALLLLGLLMVPEILRLLAVRFDAPVLQTAGDYTPAPAGYRFMFGEWEFGLVLLAWACGGLVLGISALRARDA